MDVKMKVEVEVKSYVSVGVVEYVDPTLTWVSLSMM